MQDQDVVVTGLGLVTPLRSGVDTNWQRLPAGASGLRRITGFETGDLLAKVAGIVPDLADYPQGFEPETPAPPTARRKMDRFIQFPPTGTTVSLESVV